MPTPTKPRPADVARWVATLAAPEPSDMTARAAWCRDGIEARECLYNMGLDTQGEPMGRTPEDDDRTELVAHALLSADDATREQMVLDAATAADLAIALAYAERAEPDPWTLTAGVPSSAGAAPLSGPCCEEAGQ